MIISIGGKESIIILNPLSYLCTLTLFGLQYHPLLLTLAKHTQMGSNFRCENRGQGKKIYRTETRQIFKVKLNI